MQFLDKVFNVLFQFKGKSEVNKLKFTTLTGLPNKGLVFLKACRFESRCVFIDLGFSTELRLLAMPNSNVYTRTGISHSLLFVERDYSNRWLLSRSSN